MARPTRRRGSDIGLLPGETFTEVDPQTGAPITPRPVTTTTGPAASVARPRIPSKSVKGKTNVPTRRNPSPSPDSVARNARKRRQASTPVARPRALPKRPGAVTPKPRRVGY